MCVTTHRLGIPAGLFALPCLSLQFEDSRVNTWGTQAIYGLPALCVPMLWDQHARVFQVSGGCPPAVMSSVPSMASSGFQPTPRPFSAMGGGGMGILQVAAPLMGCWM